VRHGEKVKPQSSCTNISCDQSAKLLSHDYCYEQMLQVCFIRIDGAVNLMPSVDCCIISSILSTSYDGVFDFVKINVCVS
jgi:hypothetical protein